MPGKNAGLNIAYIDYIVTIQNVLILQNAITSEYLWIKWKMPKPVHCLIIPIRDFFVKCEDCISLNRFCNLQVFPEKYRSCAHGPHLCFSSIKSRGMQIFVVQSKN